MLLFSLSQTAVIAEIGDGGVFNYKRGFYWSAHHGEFWQNGRKAVNSQNFSDGENKNNVSNIFLTNRTAKG